MKRNMVVDPVSLTPDWLEKRDGIFQELARQTRQAVENPGTGLTLNQLQLVTEHRNPFEKPAFPAEPAEKFELFLDLGIITVPANYVHATQLASFRVKYQDAAKPSFYFYNDGITDKNFGNPSRILKPGDKFEVTVFRQIVEGLTTATERLAFLAKQSAIYTGAQGASLVWEQKRKQMPKGYAYVSMDEEARLLRGASGSHGVPGFLHGSSGDWHFDLGSFEDDWSAIRLLLCFREVKA